MRFTKYLPNIVFWILLFLLLYSNYTISSFVYDYRILFCSIVTLLILVRLFTIKDKIGTVNIPTLILIFSYFFLSVLDLAKGLYASALGSLMFVFMIMVINSYNFEKTFKQIVTLNQFNNILALIFFITAIIFTGRGRNVFGFTVPYFTSYASQPSLIPALLMLPIAIYLLFYEKYQTFFFTILTIAVCFSGNAYMAIFIALLLYFIINRFSKFLFIVIPFLLMIVFILCLSYLDSTYSNKSLMLSTKAKEFTNSKGALDWKIERTISGSQRFGLYSDQLKSTGKNILLGSSSVKDFQSLGSIMLKFPLRGGVVILITMTIFLGYLLSELYKYNKFFPDKKVGVVLAYSLVIQAIVYNEMGFYSLYTIALLFILIKLLQVKNKNSLSEVPV
jgi:hypothetical protein